MTETTIAAWRLLIIGAGEVAAELAVLAPRIGFTVSLNEPRTDRRNAWPHQDMHWLEGKADQAVREFAPDAFSAVIALCHVQEIDDAALRVALPSPAFYVGAIGSRANAQARLERLAAAGLNEAVSQRIKAPIGLSIGSRSPAEIAISILAELIAERSRVAKEATGPQCVANVS